MLLAVFAVVWAVHAPWSWWIESVARVTLAALSCTVTRLAVVRAEQTFPVQFTVAIPTRSSSTLQLVLVWEFIIHTLARNAPVCTAQTLPVAPKGFVVDVITGFTLNDMDHTVALLALHGVLWAQFVASVFILIANTLLTRRITIGRSFDVPISRRTVNGILLSLLAAVLRWVVSVLPNAMPVLTPGDHWLLLTIIRAAGGVFWAGVCQAVHDIFIFAFLDPSAFPVGGLEHVVVVAFVAHKTAGSEVVMAAETVAGAFLADAAKGDSVLLLTAYTPCLAPATPAF